MNEIRVGIGFDAHSFIEKRPLIMGGILIDYPLGLAGHSDADVLTHAIMDSVLGASSMGDIGSLFPDSNHSFKNIKSLLLLEEVYKKITSAGWQIINIDTVIICQKPKIAPYINSMKKALSGAMGEISPDRIGIKGTTTEKMGFTGRGEGIAAESVALLSR